MKRTIDNKGISMVVAIILTMVLLILGVAILTFASNNATDTSVSKMDHTNYYIGKSTINAINDSLIRGELGRIITDKVRADINISHSGSISKTVSERAGDNIIITGNRLEDYDITDFKFEYSYTSSWERVYGSNREFENRHIVISPIKISFVLVNKRDNEEQFVSGSYQYEGTYTREEGWSESWNVLGVEE